jgi:Tol biopolymer transport system component
LEAIMTLGQYAGTSCRHWSAATTVVIALWGGTVGIGQEVEPDGGEPLASFRGKIVLFGSRAADRNAALIQTMSVDGTAVRTLAEFENASILPGRVSPEGRRVVFNLARRQNTRLQVCVMDANGEHDVVAEDVTVAAWMPDGKRIACYRGDRGHWKSLAIDVDSDKIQRLPMAGTDVVNDVSPDGWELLVMSRPADKFFKHPTLGIYRKRQIYRMPTDGTQRLRLTDPETDNIWSRFSPDGRKIAFYHRSYETGEPVESGRVMDLDGRSVKEVVNFTELGLRSYYAPCWVADGKRLVWPANTVSDPRGRFDVELIVTSFDGAAMKRLKSNDAGIDRWGFPDCR